MKVVIQVTLGALTLRNSELEGLEVYQELGQHTRCRIEFTRDQAQQVSLEELLKVPVTVTVQEDDGAPLQIFTGRVADGSQTHLVHFGARFVLEAISPSVRHEFRDTVYFPQSTLATILARLGAKLAGKPRRDPGPFDHVQWGETEFEFLHRLADEHGCFLVTSGDVVELRSEFLDRGWELRWGETLLELTARAHPVNHGIAGASYDPKAKSTSGHAGVRVPPETFDGAAQVVAGLVGTLKELAKTFAGGGDPLLAEPSGRVSDHGSFKALLRHESERALGAAVLTSGVAGKPGLQAGDLVTLVEGADFKLPIGGLLGLIRVVHTFADQHYIAHFTATPWKTFTSLESPPRRVLAGPVTAEVVEVGGDPEKMGRVKVRYRWQNTNEQTNWARVVVPHAGNGRGFMFLPEVGDEVMVCFEQGDPERPFVIGSLWNGKDLAPAADEKNNAKRLITRSGNTIQFLDEPGKETIEIFTPEGKCLLQLTNAGGTPVVTVHSDGDIALEAAQQIRLKCQSLVQEISGDSVRKVGGAESADIKGDATLKAGMQLALEGLNTALKAGANLESVAGAVNNMVGTLVHIQPPGFMAKQVQAKPASVKKTDLGERTTPEGAEPKRTDKVPTPRSA